MKYRIKIITYNTGEKRYFAQVKKFIRWKSINGEGKEVDYTIYQDSREKSLERIDLHFKKYNFKSLKIEFEYVIK